MTNRKMDVHKKYARSWAACTREASGLPVIADGTRRRIWLSREARSFASTLRRTSQRVCSTRALAARSSFRVGGFQRQILGTLGGNHALALENHLSDFLGKILVVEQELLGVLAALAKARGLVVEP